MDCSNHVTFRWLILLWGLLIAASLPAGAKDWAAALKEAKWEWVDAYATLDCHVQQYYGKYRVRVSADGVDFMGPAGIIVHRQSHRGSAFVAIDDALYWAEYSPIASGCQLLCFSLRSGKQLWSCQLQGLGPVSHSQYANAVRLEVHEDTIWVWSQESGGNYAEIVDGASGLTLAKRIFPR